MRDARSLDATTNDAGAVAAANDFAARLLRLDRVMPMMTSIGGSDAQDDMFRQTYLRRPQAGPPMRRRISST